MDSALYSYEAKYFNADSRTDIHPDLPDGVYEEVRRMRCVFLRLWTATGFPD